MRSRASPALLPADRLELALGASLCQRQEAVVTMNSGNISRFTQNRQQLLSFPGLELPNAWILRHDGEGLGRTHCGQTALWVWSSTVHVPSSLASVLSVAHSSLTAILLRGPRQGILLQFLCPSHLRPPRQVSTSTSLHRCSPRSEKHCGSEEGCMTRLPFWSWQAGVGVGSTRRQ